MEKGKNIISRSLIAGAIIAAGFSANAASNCIFRYNNLGSGESVRANLLNKSVEKNFELKCSSKSDSTSMKKKGKDGKCGEGKCSGKSGSKKSN